MKDSNSTHYERASRGWLPYIGLIALGTVVVGAWMLTLPTTPVSSESQSVKRAPESRDLRDLDLSLKLSAARVNRFTSSTQANSAVAIGPNEQSIVVWDSRRQQEGTYGIYLQRFDHQGAPLGDETQVNLYETSMQRNPAVAANGKGAWVAWESFGQDGSMNGIVGRRFSGAGFRGSDEVLVNQTTLGQQTQVVMAAHQNGGATFAWTTFDAKKKRSVVVARAFDSDLKPLTDEFVVAPSQHDQFLPSIANNGDDQSLIVWQESDRSTFVQTVRGQLLAKDFSRDGEPIVVSDADQRSQVEPVVTADHDGTWAMVWMAGNESAYDVKFQRFDSLGSPLGSPIKVNTSDRGYLSGAAVATTASGEVVVAWNQKMPSALEQEIDVMVRRFDDNGQPKTDAIMLTQDLAGVQQMTSASGKNRLAVTAAGQCVCVWNGSIDGDSSAVALTVASPADSNYQLLSSHLATEPDKPGHVIQQTAQPHDPPTFNRKDLKLGRNGGDFSPAPRGNEFGFVGIAATGWTPPDPVLAVGPNHLVAMTNGEIAFFEKDGTKVFEDQIENSNGFWGELGAQNFVFDPEILYDPASQRFFAMACERSNGSFFLLAVSDDDDPNGTWFKYRLDVTSLAGSDIDSPNMAIDENGVYLTADFFSPSDYLIVVLDKADVLAGVANPSQTSTLVTGSHSYGAAMNYDPIAANEGMYMIQAFEFGNFTSVRLHNVVDPLSSPTVVSQDIAVPSYGHPLDPVSQGTTQQPELFEARFWSCVKRNGSLWAVHHQSPSGTLPARVRWYEFDLQGWPSSGSNPVLKQSGDIPHNASNGYTFFPSIWVDEFNNAAITFAASSPNELISMNRSLRKWNDPLGQFEPYQLVRPSERVFSGGRWGDYSGTMSDPAEPRTFWGVHEYFPSGGSWNTWIGKFTVDPSEVVVSADEFRIERGSVESGDLDELAESDDLYLVLKERIFVRNPDLPRAEMVVEATSPVPNPVGLRFRLETSTTTDNFWQRIWLYDFEAEAYELFDDRDATLNDSIVVVQPTGDLSRFVDPASGTVRAKLGWRSIGDFVRAPKRVRVDEAIWLIEY